LETLRFNFGRISVDFSSIYLNNLSSQTIIHYRVLAYIFFGFHSPLRYFSKQARWNFRSSSCSSWEISSTAWIRTQHVYC